MAMVAVLDVVLGVKSDQFAAGMDKAAGKVDRFGQKVNSAGGSGGGGGFGALGIAAGAVAASVAAAGAALAALTVHEMGAIDAMAKTSDKLGISTEKLAGLQHAADLSGVSAEGLETSLQKMQKMVSEAGHGSQEAASALQELGLSADALKGTAPEEMLGQFADALNRVGDQGDKMRLVMDVFGKGGATMIPMLKDGAAGLAAMDAEAVKLGLTLSRDQAASVEAANDAWSRLKSAFAGVGRAIAVAAAPAIESLVNWFTELVVSARQIYEQIVPGLQASWDAMSAVFIAGKEIIGGVFGVLFGWFGDLADLLTGGAVQSWRDFGNGVIGVLRKIEFMFRNWRLSIAQGIAQLSVWWNDLFGSEESAAAAQATLDAILEEKAQKWEEFLESKTAKAATKATLKTGGAGEQMQAKVNNLFAPGQATERSKEAFDVIAKAMRAGLGFKGDPVPPLIEKTNAAINVVASEAKRTNQLLKDAPVLAPAAM